MNLLRLAWPALAAAAAITAAAATMTAPADTRATAPFVLDQDIKVNVASPPFGRAGRQYPLVRLGEVRFHVETDGRLTATGRGSITTAARADYALRLTLRAADGKEIATVQTVEHVQHIELGRVLTALRTWRFDFGKGLYVEKVNTFAADIASAREGAGERHQTRSP